METALPGLRDKLRRNLYFRNQAGTGAISEYSPYYGLQKADAIQKDIELIQEQERLENQIKDYEKQIETLKASIIVTE